jgi:hypothetical protein
VKCCIEMGSDVMIQIPYFMTISSGVQLILRISLRNFGGCNVGITDGWDL